MKLLINSEDLYIGDLCLGGPDAFFLGRVLKKSQPTARSHAVLI
jgi:hypothetical protein